MNNYRITFLHDKQCDYWGKNPRGLQAEAHVGFRAWADEHWAYVKKCLDIVRSEGIQYVWFFHEPFIEVTWLCDNRDTSLAAFTRLEAYLDSVGITDYRRHFPENGKFADWYCRNEREREFGAKCHSLCAQWVELYREYKEDVDRGMGLDGQVKRTIHRISNPAGINYIEEAKCCFSRGLICVLFRLLPFNKAVWVYKKVLRQDYP
jgi:hypothetical protein